LSKDLQLIDLYISGVIDQLFNLVWEFTFILKNLLSPSRAINN
jgi:hypothetical protein